MTSLGDGSGVIVGQRTGRILGEREPGPDIGARIGVSRPNVEPIAGPPGMTGPPGEPGPPGPTGAPGLDGHASYVQTTPAAEWTWTHGLGRRSMPTLFLSTDLTEAVWTDVTHVDDNTLIVTWPTPVAGRIYL